MALGAGRRDVLRLSDRAFDCRLLGAIGTSAALILAEALPSLTHLLYGISASDPLMFVAGSLILMSTAILACYIPAGRAAGLEPMITLRSE